MPKSPLIALAMLAVACGSTSDSTEPDAARASTDASALPGEVDAGSTPAIATFHSDAAAAICGALFRCCDGGDLEGYFAPHLGSELLTEFHHRLPPNATLDEAECRAVVAEMSAVTPFGDWVRAAERDAVGFDAAAFASCVAALDDAQCGESARAALFDGTCLGFSPPNGGDDQRAIFHRTAQPGAVCTPIRDGVGAAFFGTCDPHTSFCCYADPANPERGCTFPFTGEGVPREGVCSAAATPGDTCSAIPPLAICRTGSSCDSYSAQCVADMTDVLDLGEDCIDDSFNLLGHCAGGFCDMFGSSKCEPLRGDDASCTYGYECAGGACADQRCAPNTTCDGTPTVTPDAGPVDPDASPSMPDAGPAADAAAAASGETCATAVALADASSVSDLAGYDSTAVGSYGTSNDYNPYESAGLPPACSLVYDAAGAEVVYAIEVDPGDRLDLRYAVEPNTIAGGIYVLDGCGSEVTWPDYDGSGMCGSNEYRSLGYCGALGCDPVEWSWTYPTEVDGSATATRTVWLVLDHLGTTAATGYQLDWRLVAAD